MAAIGIGHLRSMFGTSDALGSRMAARAVVPLGDPDTIAAATGALTEDLLTAIR
jgi:hypothetical protein